VNSGKQKHGAKDFAHGCNIEFSILMIMITAIVEIKNSVALELLHHLENIGMLRMLNTKPIAVGQKISERFAGSLSKESVCEMQKELNSMRSEWERDTF
jgi:HAMP domain-containing protein